MVKCHDAELDRTFAALSDPSRRALLRRLSAGDARVTDLARPFSMSLPAISKHLHVLERAGLLRRQRQGREHLLHLNAAPLQKASRWMEAYRTFWESSLDALAAHLENTSDAAQRVTKKTKPKARTKP